MNTRNRSKREKRKGARKEKNQNMHLSWLEQQKLLRLKRVEQSKRQSDNSKPKQLSKSESVKKERKGGVKEENTVGDHSSEKSKPLVELELKAKSKSSRVDASIVSKTRKVLNGLKRCSRKTKFEEFLEMDMEGANTLAREDLEIERRLAKKLKIKDGLLDGINDGMNLLFKGIPSILDDSAKGELPGKAVEDVPSSKKCRMREQEQGVPVVGDGDGHVRDGISELEEAPGIEAKLVEVSTETSTSKKRKERKKSKSKQIHFETDTANMGTEPVETHDEIEVKVQENTSTAPSVASGSKYIAPHLRSCAGNESEEHTQIRRRVRGLLNRLSESNVESVTGEMVTIFRSVSRSVSSQIISDEVLAACSSGPRGSEQYAAVFAAFVAGMACFVGMDFSARLIQSLAKTFENEYLKEDNLSLRNLTLLFSYLYIFGVFSSDLVYDFQLMLSKRLGETDVSTILTVLQCCGMNIRGDDPAAMKNFIQSVQHKVNELKASTSENQENITGKRMEFMLETICDIKNNKKKPKEETVPHTRFKKWLQKLRVDDILIRGLTWSKLLDPNKKGQWWLSGDMDATTDNIKEVASIMDTEAQEAQKILQLAASQRMNTDTRRAIFCIIMSGEDYIDAFEKLLRLDLPGKQDREIMRVLVECCLQEKVFNKYYTALASKLCEHDKNHKFTLQYCLWDHFKELESMLPLRSMHLANFTAEMVASFTLSLAVLKSVELIDAGQLTPKVIMHFRLLFESIFDYSDKVIWNIFTRVAVTPELETLRGGVEFFIKEYVVKTKNALANKFKLVKKALSNAEGVLM